MVRQHSDRNRHESLIVPFAEREFSNAYFPANELPASAAYKTSQVQRTRQNFIDPLGSVHRQDHTPQKTTRPPHRRRRLPLLQILELDLGRRPFPGQPFPDPRCLPLPVTLRARGCRGIHLLERSDHGSPTKLLWLLLMLELSLPFRRDRHDSMSAKAVSGPSALMPSVLSLLILLNPPYPTYTTRMLLERWWVPTCMCDLPCVAALRGGFE